MKYEPTNEAVAWLKEKGFEQNEINHLAELLNRFQSKMNEGNSEFIKLPRNTSKKVGTVFHLLYSITDAEGKPLCFDETTIRIPGEARRNYRDNIELAELEDLMGKLNKAKFARGKMDPRRRS